MIQNWDEDLIDSYLKDELSPKEKAELEALAKNDAELQERLYLDKLILEALQDKEEKLNMLQEWTIKKGDRHKKDIPLWKNPKVIISISAIAASILAGGLFLYSHEDETSNTADNKTTNPTIESKVTAKTDIKQNDKRTFSNTNNTRHQEKKDPPSSTLPSNTINNEGQDNFSHNSELTAKSSQNETNELEPTETDNMTGIQKDKRAINKDRQLALQYKDCKADFYALYADSSVAEKQWHEFLANPSNKKWDIVRASLDKKLKNRQDEHIVKKKQKDKNISKQ